MTHYISGLQNGDCQTLAKGLFLLTNCSRGFRSVGLLVRRQSSLAASLSSSLSSSSKRVAGAIFVVFPRPSKSFNICQQTGQDAFDVERVSTTTENVPSGLRQIAFSMMEILKYDLYFIFTDLDTFVVSTSLEIVPKYEYVAKLK
jgi:hypothetical protein